MKRLALQSAVLLVLFCAAAASAQMRIAPADKDMDAVQKIHLAPFTVEDAQNAPLRASLKSELVHNGFIVLEKQEGSDATLSVEVISGQQGKLAKLETHSLLDAGPDSRVAWHLSSDKTGPDMAKLVENAARNIANSLHTYREDVKTKKREQKEKQK